MAQGKGGQARTNLRHGLAVAFALALAACANTEQVRERQATAQATEAEEDDAKCKAQGYEPDTPGYVHCRDRLGEKRIEHQAAQARRHEEFQRTLGQGTSALSDH